MRRGVKGELGKKKKKRKKEGKHQYSIYEHANLNRMSTSHVISHVNFCTRKIHHRGY